MDFNKFYLRQSNTDSDVIYQIHLDSHGKIGLDEKELVENLHVEQFEDIFQLRTIMHVNFYRAQLMVSTAFMVAHRRLLFIYDVLLNKVVKKLEFSSDIIKLQRAEVIEGVFNVLAVMDNGAISILVNNDEEYMTPTGWNVDASLSTQLPGKPV